MLSSTKLLENIKSINYLRSLLTLYLMIAYLGAPRGVRTPDRWIRSPALYPAEL